MAGEEASGGAMKFVRSLGRLSVGIRHRKLPRISLLWREAHVALGHLAGADRLSVDRVGRHALRLLPASPSNLVLCVGIFGYRRG